MIKYFIYDSRYLVDEDKATVLEVCDTLEEAVENAPDYGDGNVIVEVTIENSIIVLKKIV